MKIGQFLDKEVATISSYLSNKFRSESESYEKIIKNPFYFIIPCRMTVLNYIL